MFYPNSARIGRDPHVWSYPRIATVFVSKQPSWRTKQKPYSRKFEDNFTWRHDLLCDVRLALCVEDYFTLRHDILGDVRLVLCVEDYFTWRHDILCELAG